VRCSRWTRVVATSTGCGQTDLLSSIKGGRLFAGATDRSSSQGGFHGLLKFADIASHPATWSGSDAPILVAMSSAMVHGTIAAIMSL
jgi:hypothetical protein